jgi:hypothetical protein
MNSVPVSLKHPSQVHPHSLESEEQGKTVNCYWKRTGKGAWGCNSIGEHLPSMCKTLHSIHGTTNK